MKNFDRLAMFCRRKLPTILAIVSAVTEGFALYFTGAATVKSVRKYDELKSAGVKITPKVIAKKFVPYYIPAIGFAATSLSCNIASNTIHVRRNRALTLTATSAMETLRSFKSKTEEVVGPQKMQEIEGECAKNAKLIRGVSYFADEVIRVYDNFTGIKFETTTGKLMDAETEVNRQINSPCMGPCRAPLKDFYRWMGVDATKIKSSIGACDYVWDQQAMIIGWELSFVDFYHEQLKDNDGTPLIILRYFPEPELEGNIPSYYE